MPRYDEIMKSKQYLPFRMGYLTEQMVAKAEKELGETEGEKVRRIAELRKIVQEETNLVCRTDDFYLLQYLRARKYNVKRAFNLLQSYYNAKKANKELYDNYDEHTMRKILNSKAIQCMPYRDEEGCVVYLIQMSRWNPDEISMGEAIIGLTFSVLFSVEDIATQVCGVQIILDVKGASLKQLKCITPRYLNLISKALRNCLPIRFKGIHIYNESIIFQYIWSIIKILLSEKIRNRVHFHGDNQKHLHKFVPKAVLPVEYGGDYPTFSNDWFNGEIEQFLETYSELTTYGYRD